jgi:hypothetical protein
MFVCVVLFVLSRLMAWHPMLKISPRCFKGYRCNNLVISRSRPSTGLECVYMRQIVLYAASRETFLSVEPFLGCSMCLCRDICALLGSYLLFSISAFVNARDTRKQKP